jgi:hypothetical protein
MSSSYARRELGLIPQLALRRGFGTLERETSAIVEWLRDENVPISRATRPHLSHQPLSRFWWLIVT